MNLPDSFYIALCMTVLLVGAVYWVWTQIQFVQRKVNVLENIVYEMKQLCEGFGKAQHVSSIPEAFPASNTLPSRDSPSPPRYPPAPPSVLDEDEDLLHETLQHESEITSEMVEDTASSQLHDITLENEIPHMPDVPEDLPTIVESVDAVEASDDLQPGGVGSGIVSEVSSLDSMTLKELRRLALQRGISGATDMSKKKLIAAIRAAPTDAFTLDAHM